MKDRSRIAGSLLSSGGVAGIQLNPGKLQLRFSLRNLLPEFVTQCGGLLVAGPATGNISLLEQDLPELVERICLVTLVAYFLVDCDGIFVSFLSGPQITLPSKDVGYVSQIDSLAFLISQLA